MFRPGDLAGARLGGRLGVDLPGRVRGVLPGPGGGRRRGALGSLRDGDEAVEVVDRTQRGAPVEYFAQGGNVGRGDRGAARECLDRWQTEALVVGGEDQRVGAGIDRRELV